MRKTQKNDSGSYTDQSRQYTDRRDQTDLPGRNAGRSGYAGYTERGGYADTSRRTGRGSYTDTVRRADRGSYADTSRRSGRGSYTDTVRRADRGSHADTSGQSGRGSYTGAPRQAERSSYAGASGRTGRGSCTDTVRRADRGSCTENKRAGRRTAARDGSGRMGGRKNRNGKRLYICLAALLALLLICGSGIFILYRGQDDKKVQEITVSLESLASPYAVLIDADTGTVLGSKNPQQKIFPASMAKIMTVLTAIEQIRDLDQTVTMSYDYYDMLYERDASRAGFEPGEEAVIRDLLYGALLPSGAECCMQLALQAAGSESAFADLMNENALKMGLTQTQFKNCTGLH
ncbi:MAG: hypothetical protein ACLVEV_09735, partial [Lachnospiraceae bacterium]